MRVVATSGGGGLVNSGCCLPSYRIVRCFSSLGRLNDCECTNTLAQKRHSRQCGASTPAPAPRAVRRQQVSSMQRPEDEARYPTWMAHSTVPRHPWRSAEASELLASNQPVVLTDCPLTATLAGRWEFATLSDLCGTHELGVHTTPAGTQTFARHYGRGLGVGTIRPMTFAAFADACAACLLYTSPSPRDQRGSRMPSSA